MFDKNITVPTALLQAEALLGRISCESSEKIRRRILYEDSEVWI
ncbi:hypothetical protein [Mesobacillus maritimus]